MIHASFCILFMGLGFMFMHATSVIATLIGVIFFAMGGIVATADIFKLGKN